jgi:hypothetical protein
MPVWCDAIGRGDVLAWPTIRQTSKGHTIPRHLQSENAQSETPAPLPLGRAQRSILGLPSATADANVARAGVIMPVRAMRIGNGDVLAWPHFVGPRKATRFRGISNQKMRSRKPPHHYPSDVLSDRSWSLLARRKVAEVR